MRWPKARRVRTPLNAISERSGGVICGTVAPLCRAQGVVHPSHMGTYVRLGVIVCVLIPRFQLMIAAGDRAELLQTPAALAPELGGTQQVGEVSRAAVEPERPGLVCFDAGGLLRLHGGIDGVLTAARRALRVPARFGVAPSRFAAVAAATKARVRRPVLVSGAKAGLASRGNSALGVDDRARARAYLAPLPVALLRARAVLADLPQALERLGVCTLGELAALPAAALADRFGKAGLLAHELASGGDSALSPRPASEFLRESLELPEAALGFQLERGVGLLIDRLLARRERRGRTLRAVVISAVLVEQGGTWHEQVVFREALADPVRMRLALTPRLALMPAPAEVLRLAVERFGPPASDQRALLEDPSAARAARLREAIRQARAAAGPEAALRVLEVDPGSRFPERRAVLAPFEG